jgi:ribonuclease H / adenosylcobalamin/alpha-ribazole phosphatase
MLPVALAVALAAALVPSPSCADPLADLAPAAPGTVRVYLVRHGQALSNLDPTPDLPAEQLDHLTDRGRVQAQTAGRALAGRGIAELLTSPAGRARETAAEIASTLAANLDGPSALRPIVETRLRPLDLGEKGDGGALDWDDRIASWGAGRDPSPPGGESMEQMGARVADLVASLAREGPPRGVVLVAHGEVIGSYLGHLRGTPPEKRYPPGLANASITVVDVSRDGTASIRLASHKAAEP